MPPTKKQICKGCATSVSSSVSCTTCGITSHRGSNCLSRCSHPWRHGQLTDCNGTSPSSATVNSDETLLDMINASLDAKFSKLENELHSFKASFELLSTSLKDICRRVENLESRQKISNRTWKQTSLKRFRIERLDQKT